MSKVAIITDTNSGIMPADGEALGIIVIPTPFMIDGVEYLEGVNLTQEWFFQKLADGADVSTSQPSPGNLLELWDKVLKEYDEIVYIPLSSGLSSSCQTATMLASDDYEGKVFVVNNQRISVTMRQSVLDAIMLRDAGMSGKEIKDKLEEVKFESSIYIMLDTLYYLKKGGRITPAAAALGTLLKLKPVLQIQGEKLDAFAKARTVNQGKNIMINAMMSDIENRFGGLDAKDVHLAGAYTYDLDKANEFKSEVEAAFPGYEMHLDPLSLVVSCHIGPGALAIACSRKIHI
ncbi:DegV family protein [Butyrivibrio sp. AE3006]|uniref:DegV family protein n=1 Tax=Butyrivibrio sp. AE3006 TaxID=1280673 RepID=UPI0003F9A214|nr:DegV family protein [Butyrivibrio sp. AE3006]